MSDLSEVFRANREWAQAVRERDPGFFQRLEGQQSPKLLWIGCSDSRVPANQICGLDPGEVFVHRNVANVVVHTDLNCLSVVQFAVEQLEVTDIIVCGHYGCGGVRAALDSRRLGLIDNWLRNIKDIAWRKRAELEGLDDAKKADRLCELNAERQAANLCRTTIVQDAWARGRDLTVHAWIYRLGDGLLKDLGLSVSRSEQLPQIYRME
ncbi:MAG: carbonate dehydratase [Myxococcota bacterium]